MTVRDQVIARDGDGCFLCPATDVRAFRIHPDKGDDLDNLVAMCGKCREFYHEGHRHRESYMSRERFVELGRRMSDAGFKRRMKPEPNVRNVLRSIGAAMK